MKRMIWPIILILVVIAGFVAIRSDKMDSSRLDTLPGSASNPDEIVWIDGIPARLILDWNFSQGLFPGGWGWGEDDWELVPGAILGRHGEGRDISVYFYNRNCGENFILETRVRLLRGSDGKDAVAQLLIRDSDKMNNESGMGIYAGTNKAVVRHMLRGKEYLSELYDLPFDIEYGEWYVMRFMLHEQKISASVNGVPIPLPVQRYLLGFYCEPHLAMETGDAEFESIRIYLIEKGEGDG